MDTSMSAITAAIKKLAEANEAFRETNDARLKAIEEGKTSEAADLSAKLDRINDSVTAAAKAKDAIEKEIKFQRERIEELEARGSVVGKTAEQKAKDDYKSTFIDFVRARMNNPEIGSKLHELAKKSVTIGSPAGGGYAVPEEIAREIGRLEKKFSPVRDLVKVVQVGTSDYKELINIRGASSGWVGESGSRTATNTPELREVAPTFGELYAYPQASEWSLDDMFFDVGAWLAEEVAEEFAIKEGQAVIDGDGSSKPTGMVNTAPVSTADFASPLRAAAAYQFVACLSTQSPAVAEILMDPLITLVYTLNSRYRSNAKWVMNSLTTAAIRKLKDTNGQYLWQPSLIVGQPDTLLGYPVATWEDMDDVATNALPVAFGDFARGYTLAERVGMRMTVDNVTNIGFVRYYIRRREGGIVTNNDAIKFLKTTIA